MPLPFEFINAAAVLIAGLALVFIAARVKAMLDVLQNSVAELAHIVDKVGALAKQLQLQPQPQPQLQLQLKEAGRDPEPKRTSPSPNGHRAVTEAGTTIAPSAHPIDWIPGLNVRTRIALHEHGIHTLTDLSNKSLDELLDIKYVGRKSLDAIQAYCKSVGVHLPWELKPKEADQSQRGRKDTQA